jgi:hypothetical protein
VSAQSAPDLDVSHAAAVKDMTPATLTFSAQEPAPLHILLNQALHDKTDNRKNH